MKVEIQELSPVRKALSIEAAPDEVAKETDAVVRRFAASVRIPGFRAGKAPVDLVRKRFAKEIGEDVKERLVTRLWGEAVRDRGLKPLGDPVLEEVTDAEGSLRFRTTFEVAPSFTVQGYRGVEVEERAGAVAEEEVDRALESIREAHARYVVEEGRAAETGDLLIADVEETVDGGETDSKERAAIEVGHADHLPPFTEALLGAKAGDRREFHVTYPAEYPAERLAGRSVRYAIAVHEVKRREVPALDDEFAKDLGDLADLAALRARVREDLETRKSAEAKRAVRQSLLDKVLLENPVVLPEVLVEEEIRSRLEDMVRAMILHGLDPRAEDFDWKALRDRQEEPARKAVHARLVLDAVAEAEGLSVDPSEVDERIRLEAERIGEKAETVRARLRKGGGLEALQIQLVREKSLDFMTSVANIRKVE